MSNLKHGIVLFDGDCNFCNSSVQFIIKRDQAMMFQFASLQSEIGQALLGQYEVDRSIDSIVVIQNEKAYTKSTAALQIAKHLDGFWKLLAILRIIPAFMRDPFYNWFAANRYRWFGKQEVCKIPTPEERARFLS